MKNLDLNAYGVVAMPKQEMQKMDGGGIVPIAKLLIGGALYVWDNWDDIKEGWDKGKGGSGAGRSF